MREQDMRAARLRYRLGRPRDLAIRKFQLQQACQPDDSLGLDDGDLRIFSTRHTDVGHRKPVPDSCNDLSVCRCSCSPRLKQRVLTRMRTALSELAGTTALSLNPVQ